MIDSIVNNDITETEELNEKANRVEKPDDLARRTASDKALRDKAFNIAKNPKYGGCQRWLASMVYKFFQSAGSGINKHSNKSALRTT